MAAGSMREIRTRIRSISGTRQLTKAMELVASSKLRGALDRVQASRPYFELMHSTVTDIAYGALAVSSPYLQKREAGRLCCVLIAGDRGLAGGYNANLFREAERCIDERPAVVLPVGKKAAEYARRRGWESLTDALAAAQEASVGDCHAASRLLAQGFLRGDYDELYLAYTNFVSMLSQNATSLKLLPLRGRTDAGEERPDSPILYEPGAQAVFDAIVPDYLFGVLYGALCESRASELAARRTAMDTASKNADEMIESLSLHYNRARQGAITQEITEIAAGAGAQEG
ncbi:ATP synthase F1 subunit gamma [Clostridiaceae bacterium NSJ-31]|uniref:ATP synthase gamma chain n=1 Tax=Ligaoa zhengdingensis TaxID=2763658 RepID=A0A926DZG0_9FIRM|nr:ATP synthase F1 subunit gamma [Ligaoa zhengdingensis]MBC8546941.1 ATP synthase F1 subunit gamma [Ligaoa zhengdingensis]